MQPTFRTMQGMSAVPSEHHFAHGPVEISRSARNDNEVATFGNERNERIWRSAPGRFFKGFRTQAPNGRRSMTASTKYVPGRAGGVAPVGEVTRKLPGRGATLPGPRYFSLLISSVLARMERSSPGCVGQDFHAWLGFRVSASVQDHAPGRVEGNVSILVAAATAAWRRALRSPGVAVEGVAVGDDGTGERTEGESPSGHRGDAGRGGASG